MLAGIATVSNSKVSYHWNLKILSLKQILQRLSIALKQVEAGNISEKFLNEIKQIINSLYRAKKYTAI